VYIVLGYIYVRVRVCVCVRIDRQKNKRRNFLHQFNENDESLIVT